jgi:hypothetical protein
MFLGLSAEESAHTKNINPSLLAESFSRRKSHS